MDRLCYEAIQGNAGTMPILKVTIILLEKRGRRLLQTRLTLLEKVLLASTGRVVRCSAGTPKWQSSVSGLKQEVLDNSVDQALD